MKTLVPVIFAVLVTYQMAHAQIAGLGNKWREVINTEGQVVFLNQDKVWAQGGRKFAIVRIVKSVNGVATYTDGKDQIAATDCGSRLRIFRTNEDYANSPLE